MKTLTYGPYTIELFTEETCRGIIYAVMDQQGIKETWHLLEGHNLALAAISGVDWNRELSPWKAPKAFRGSEDFGGQASALLDQIVNAKSSRCVGFEGSGSASERLADTLSKLI